MVERPRSVDVRVTMVVSSVSSASDAVVDNVDDDVGLTVVNVSGPVLTRDVVKVRTRVGVTVGLSVGVSVVRVEEKLPGQSTTTSLPESACPSSEAGETPWVSAQASCTAFIALVSPRTQAVEQMPGRSKSDMRQLVMSVL
jgi:hypothetical protein